MPPTKSRSPSLGRSYSALDFSPKPSQKPDIYDRPESAARKDAQALSTQILKWVSGVTGIPAGSLSMHEYLKDGLVLCYLANKISPGIIADKDIKRNFGNSKAFQSSRMRDNISNFRNALRKFGMREIDLFDTDDLFLAKDLQLVCKCLHAFGRLVPESSSYKGFSEVLCPRRCSRRAGKPADDIPAPMCLPMSLETEMLCSDACQWVSAVTGIEMGSVTMHEYLQDGTVLCALANAIRPGIIAEKDISTGFGSTEGFLRSEMRANISHFRSALRKLGVREVYLFDVDDLFMAKDLETVSKCLFALGGVIQDTCKDFNGPAFGIRGSSGLSPRTRKDLYGKRRQLEELKLGDAVKCSVSDPLEPQAVNVHDANSAPQDEDIAVPEERSLIDALPEKVRQAASLGNICQEGEKALWEEAELPVPQEVSACVQKLQTTGDLRPEDLKTKTTEQPGALSRGATTGQLGPKSKLWNDDPEPSSDESEDGDVPGALHISLKKSGIYSSEEMRDSDDLSNLSVHMNTKGREAGRLQIKGLKQVAQTTDDTDDKAVVTPPVHQDQGAIKTPTQTPEEYRIFTQCEYLTPRENSTFKTPMQTPEEYRIFTQREYLTTPRENTTDVAELNQEARIQKLQMENSDLKIKLKSMQAVLQLEDDLRTQVACRRPLSSRAELRTMPVIDLGFVQLEMLSREVLSLYSTKTDIDQVIDRHYSQDCKFVDPLVVVHGQRAVKAQFRSLSMFFKHIDLDLHTVGITGNKLTIEATTTFCPRMLPRICAVRVHQFTMLTFTELGRISIHEDHWSAHGTLALVRPIVGTLYNRSRCLLGNVSSTAIDATSAAVDLLRCRKRKMHNFI